MDLDQRKENAMEGLAPPLKCLIEIQSTMSNGESVRQGLMQYLQSASPKDGFATEVRTFLHLWEQGRDWRARIASHVASPYRRALLELIASALAGQSILPQLADLKVDMTEACEQDIRHHLELLPLKMLIPLLIFQFPAFLLLLFGPLLRNLIQELNH
jgi:hypothetical protein